MGLQLFRRKRSYSGAECIRLPQPAVSQSSFLFKKQAKNFISRTSCYFFVRCYIIITMNTSGSAHCRSKGEMPPFERRKIPYATQSTGTSQVREETLWVLPPQKIRTDSDHTGRASCRYGKQQRHGRSPRRLLCRKPGIGSDDADPGCRSGRPRRCSPQEPPPPAEPGSGSARGGCRGPGFCTGCPGRAACRSGTCPGPPGGKHRLRSGPAGEGVSDGAAGRPPDAHPGGG